MADETQATAESPATVSGDSPQTAPATTTATTTTATSKVATPPRTPEQILEDGTVEEIQALMLEQSARQPKGPPEIRPGIDDVSAFERATPPKPGETAGEGEGTTTETAETDTTTATRDPNAPAAQPTEQRDPPTRVRIKRFAEGDQALIARAAEKGISLAQARAELQSEGTIPAQTQETTPARSEAQAQTQQTDAVAQQEGIVTDLERQIGEAAERFDAKEQARLSTQHTRAVAKLSQLENRRDAQAQAQQAQAHQQWESDKTASETQAIALFPDAGKEGTPLHEAIEDLMDAARPEAFADPDYPLTFAAKAAAKIGYKAAAESKAPVVVPKKPVRTAPVSPASGNTPGQGPAAGKGPTRDQQLDEAYEKGDVATIERLMNEVGTKVGS